MEPQSRNFIMLYPIPTPTPHPPIRPHQFFSWELARCSHPSKKNFCMRHHLTKLTTTQHDFNPTIFWVGWGGVINPPPWVNPTCIFLDKEISDPNLSDQRFFFDPKKLLTSKFLTTNFFDPNFFWTQNYFDPKFLFDPKIIWPQNFLTPNFFDPQIFSTPKFFWPSKFLTPKLFWPRNFFYPKIIFTQKFF